MFLAESGEKSAGVSDSATEKPHQPGRRACKANLRLPDHDTPIRSRRRQIPPVVAELHPPHLVRVPVQDVRGDSREDGAIADVIAVKGYGRVGGVIAALRPLLFLGLFEKRLETSLRDHYRSRDVGWQSPLPM